MKHTLKHLARAFLLAITLAACSAIVLHTASLTSMNEMKTHLANDGKGLLCELGRHTSQAVHQPNVPALRWYVDLSTGVAHELSSTEIVAMGLTRPIASIHSLFGVRQDLRVLQSEDAIDDSSNSAMLPVLSEGTIKEFALERDGYSLRSTGGGENFRIELRKTRESAPDPEPIELLMHAAISTETDRIVTFSSRGKPTTPNTQLRDFTHPDTILTEWTRSEACLPSISSQCVFTLSNDKSSVERRSLQTGKLLDSTPFSMPAGTSPIVMYLDAEKNLFIGRDKSLPSNGMIVGDFNSGVQIAFVPDAYPLDYAPNSNCILLQPLSKPYSSRSVFSINDRKIVDLEGVTEGNLRALHLCPSDPRAIAVLSDGSIQIHSLPDGNRVSQIESMQNHKETWLVLSVFSLAAWLTCLMVTGKSTASYESIDIVLAIAVIWGSLFSLHQRTGFSIGLGGILSSFSVGSVLGVAIILSEWSLHKGRVAMASNANSATKERRLVPWTLTIGLLIGILAITFRDQLNLDACSLREAVLGGIGYLGLCVTAGTQIDAWMRRRFKEYIHEKENRGQFSITYLLWCTSLVAVTCSMLSISTANNHVDWIWLFKFLLINVWPIFFGMACCSYLRIVFVRTETSRVTSRQRILGLIGIIALVIAGVWVTALLSWYFLYRGFPQPLPLLTDFCLWYTVGFVSIFSLLLYRTV